MEVARAAGRPFVAGTERFSLLPGSGTLSPRRGFLLDVEIASPGPTSDREIRQETSMQTLSANCHREPSRQLVRPSKLMLLLTTFMLAAGIPSALATRFIPMPPVFATVLEGQQEDRVGTIAACSFGDIALETVDAGDTSGGDQQ